jgi:hypothetical protein
LMCRRGPRRGGTALGQAEAMLTSSEDILTGATTLPPTVRGPAARRSGGAEKSEDAIVRCCGRVTPHCRALSFGSWC